MALPARKQPSPLVGDTSPPVIDVDSLTPEQFDRICSLLHRLTGINLQAGKEQLVKARLAKRLRHLSLPDFGSYLQAIEADPSGRELSYMVDSLTTNKTSFFRENDHFRYFATDMARKIGSAGPIHIWSAGCSAGQEPYSIAMTLLEEVPPDVAHRCRILATDISSVVLAKAKEGTYSSEETDGLPPHHHSRYFTDLVDRNSRLVRTNDTLRSLIKYARLNLMGPWPMRGLFDYIFCRNVMIYFDKPTQERLVNRFSGALKPGGLLFVGHSESLSGITHDLAYTVPAVYRKN